MMIPEADGDSFGITFRKATVMELDWMLGRRMPQERMVTTAKMTAYHFFLRPFSM
ncbi:MAG: hypothetical protein BWX98_02565 [Candidatus Aminicenantes bacterium ADurb.Bin147]|nr:MAG: hypothetical protein BWX98_02572 [Candidatus Aminicenantes bacterium ADurb.Bin147]OQB51165.1 MAG: hypothetical protein BWX98_02565 [Candidatus Aminicenantes bacterium ADurb.Bin147]